MMCDVRKIPTFCRPEDLLMADTSWPGPGVAGVIMRPCKVSCDNDAKWTSEARTGAIHLVWKVIAGACHGGGLQRVHAIP